MYQGEEGRKAYEESCRNKCCGGHGKYGHAVSVDNGDWDVAAPVEESVKQHEIARLVYNIVVNVEPNDDIEVIRVEFRDAGWIDVPVDGRTLHVVEYESAFVVVEQQQDDKPPSTEKHAIAHFPVDAVRSIVRMTVKR